jgi:hypothetical protein
LSGMEHQIFEKEILPLLEIDCVNCHLRMDADDLHEAYLREACAGLIYCRGCRS